MKKVKFSIITPTFNRASTGFLTEVLNTVRTQKKGDFSYEHIIVDDGSIDNTKEVINKEILKDSRIKYIYQKNSGTPLAIRKGISLSEGDYIIILGDDDLLPKNSLYERSVFIKNNPGIDWFYGKTQWVDDNGKSVKTWTQSTPLPDHPYERMLAENFIQGGTTTIKSIIYKKIIWPQWLKKSDDYFLAMELLRPSNNYKIKYMDKLVYKYRRHNRGTGMQSGRALKNKKIAEERWELDNRIRNLHPAGLAYLSSELNSAWRENRILNQEIKDLKFKLKTVKSEITYKNKIINDIYSSRGWKTLEIIKKPIRLIKNVFKFKKDKI